MATSQFPRPNPDLPSLDPDDIPLWHESGSDSVGAGHEAFGRVWFWLLYAVDVPPVALQRLMSRRLPLPEAQNPDREAAKDYMVETLDMLVNIGGVRGGQVWQHRDIDAALARQPGIVNEKVIGVITKKHRTRRFKGLRFQIGSENIDVRNPLQLLKGARKIVHYRHMRDAGALDTDITVDDGFLVDERVATRKEIGIPVDLRIKYIGYMGEGPDGAEEDTVPGGEPDHHPMHGDPVEQLLMKDTQYQHVTEEKLAALVMAAEQGLTTDGARQNSLPWRFLVLTRAFLAYVAEACSFGATQSTLHHGWPSFAKWLCDLPGIDAPDPAGMKMEQMEALIVALDSPHWNAAEIPDDMTLAALIERLQDLRDETDRRRIKDRYQRLCHLIGPTLTDHEADLLGRDRAGIERIEKVCRAHFDRLALRLDALRLAGLRERLEGGGWQKLAGAERAVGLLSTPHIDPKRWQMAAEPGLVKGQIVRAESGAIPASHQPLFERWHHACFALLVGAPGRWLCPECGAHPELKRIVEYRFCSGSEVAAEKGRCEICTRSPEPPGATVERHRLESERWWQTDADLKGKYSRQRLGNALDQAKNRKEEDGNLDAFYLFIGHMPVERKNSSGNKTLCDRLRSLYGRFLEGNILPQEGQEFREHLEECSDCFWAFSDYVADRIAWGYDPKPMVAALREQLLRVSHARFNLQLGLLPSTLSELLAAYHKKQAQFAQMPRLSPTGQRTETTPPEKTFVGFGLEAGEKITLDLLNSEGRSVGSAGAVVAEVHCDPAERNASVLLSVEGMSEPASLIVARAEAGGVKYSVAGELHEGRATLVITDFPVEFGSPQIRNWYAILMEEEQD